MEVGEFHSSNRYRLRKTDTVSFIRMFTWSSIKEVGRIIFSQTTSDLRLCVYPHGYLRWRPQRFLDSMRAPMSQFWRIIGDYVQQRRLKTSSREIQRNWLPEEQCFSVHDKLFREMHGLRRGKFCCQRFLIHHDTKGPYPNRGRKRRKWFRVSFISRMIE